MAASGTPTTSVASSVTLGEPGDLSWVTSHTFRKTAATILEEAALSARLIADQLGHAWTPPSGQMRSNGEKHGKSMASARKRTGSAAVHAADLEFCTP